MKTSIRGYVCSIAVMSSFCITTAQSPIPPAITGTFLFSEQGSVNTTQPYAALGSLTFDGNGSVSGSETLQANGVAATNNLSGVYTLAADGSGSLTLMYNVAATDGADTTTTYSTYSIVVAGTNTIKAIRIDGGVVGVVAMDRLVAPASNMQGTYTFTEQGAAAGSPFVALGELKFDGVGNIRGSQVVKSVDRTLVQPATGTYTLAVDGSGTMNLVYNFVDSDGNPQTLTSSYKIYASGQNVKAIRSDNGLSAISSLTRQ